MKRLPGITLLLLLSACGLIPLRGPDKVPPPKMDPGELKDNAIGPESAEPIWHDIIRHTMVQSPDRASHPGPSPDGRLFAYVSTEFGPHPQVVVRDTCGVAPSQITNNSGDNLFPRISPDGKFVAWSSNKDGNWDVYVTRIATPAAISQVTFEPGDDVAPSWSPDGKRLVYCSPTANNIWQIVIADVATRIKTYLGPGMYPDWSSDREDPWICFQSQPRVLNGRSGVWIVRPDGSGLREVVGDKRREWSAINPRFSPDGRWIAYATVMKSRESRAFGVPEEADDIWIIRPDGTLDTRLTDDLSAEWWPAWGGNRVFFVSNRGGGQNIFSVQPKPLEDEKVAKPDALSIPPKPVEEKK